MRRDRRIQRLHLTASDAVAAVQFKVRADVRERNQEGLAAVMELEQEKDEGVAQATTKHDAVRGAIVEAEDAKIGEVHAVAEAGLEEVAQAHQEALEAEQVGLLCLTTSQCTGWRQYYERGMSHSSTAFARSPCMDETTPHRKRHCRFAFCFACATASPCHIKACFVLCVFGVYCLCSSMCHCACGQRLASVQAQVEKDLKELKKWRSDPKRFEKMERRKALGRKETAEMQVVNKEHMRLVLMQREELEAPIRYKWVDDGQPLLEGRQAKLREAHARAVAEIVGEVGRSLSCWTMQAVANDNACLCVDVCACVYGWHVFVCPLSSWITLVCASDLKIRDTAELRKAELIAATERDVEALEQAALDKVASLRLQCKEAVAKEKTDCDQDVRDMHTLLETQKAKANKDYKAEQGTYVHMFSCAFSHNALCCCSSHGVVVGAAFTNIATWDTSLMWSGFWKTGAPSLILIRYLGGGGGCLEEVPCPVM